MQRRVCRDRMATKKEIIHFALLEASTGAELLQRLEGGFRSIDSNFSYTKMAKMFGFSSRSFARALFVGEKKINSKTIENLVRGLELSSLQTKLCRLLFELDHSEDRTAKMHALRRLLQKAQNRKKVSVSKMPVVISADYPCWPLVYAALGERSSIDEIIRKTGLARNRVTRSLSEMKKSGLLREDNGLFYAEHSHVILDSASFQKMIQIHFIETMRRGLKAAEYDFSSLKHLSFVSSFSVQESEIPRLRKALEEVLLRFVDHHEQPVGDRVVTVGVTLV